MRIVLLSFSLTTSKRKASLKALFTLDKECGIEGYENGLSSRSVRVLPALMETRSCEPPLTAAKPIYLRPRFFPVPFLLPCCRDPLLLPEFVADSFSLRLSRSIILSFSVAPPRRPSCRVHRGSCLTREYFTFPCCRNEKKRRVVPCWHQRDMKKFDFYSQEAKSLFAKRGERREREREMH